MACSQDGSQFASVSANEICRWDGQTGTLIGRTIISRGPGSYSTRSVAYLPGRDVIVTGLSDGSVQQWGSETGRVRGEPCLLQRGAVRSLSATSEGVLIAGSDKGVLGRFHTGTPRQALCGVDVEF